MPSYIRDSNQVIDDRFLGNIEYMISHVSKNITVCIIKTKIVASRTANITAKLTTATGNVKNKL